MAIFLDTDGVMADFNTHAHDFLGAHPETVGDTAFWQIANANPHFWHEMPVIPGAHEFFDRIRHLDPMILTGAPSGNFEYAAAAKRLWWKRHFDYDRVEVVLSKNKHLYVDSPQDVLIDDTYRLIKKWRNAGGIGILFKSYEQALGELRAIGLLDGDAT